MYTTLREQSLSISHYEINCKLPQVEHAKNGQSIKLAMISLIL